MKNNNIPSVLDIEASGFGADSYPIEIGVVTSTGEKYCSLIKPNPEWTHWSVEAESLHGISRKVLETKGRPLREVCEHLNSILSGTVVYSDAWVHDHPWIRKLFFFARLELAFQLSAIEHIVTEAQLNMWDEVKQDVAVSLGIQRHRASSDALIIQNTFLETLKRQNH